MADMTTGPERSETGALYRTLVEQISAITYVDTLDSGKPAPLYVSPQLESLLGIPQATWLRDPTAWRRFIHPEDRDETIERFVDGLASGGSFGLVYRIVRPDGRIVWIDERAAVLPDEQGRPRLLHGVMIDVTEAHEAEEAARRGTSLLSATLESTGDGILVVDTRGEITAFNQRFVDMWRIPRSIVDSRDDDRVLAAAVGQLIEPDRFLDEVRRLYATPAEESFDVLEFSDGRIFERRSLPQRLGDDIVGRVWSFRDVTEQRYAETEYRSLIERLPAVVYIAVPGTGSDWLYISSRIEQMLGFTPDEWRGDPLLWYRQIHDDDRERVVEEEATTTEAHDPLVSEYRMIARDGRVVWVRDEAEYVPGPGGGPGLLRGLMYDITERKLMEEELRGTVERVLLVAAATNDAVWDWDLVNDERWWSDEHYRLLGWEPGKIAPTYEDWASKIHPDDRDRVERGSALALARGDDVWSDEFRYLRPDGSYGYLFDRAFVVRDIEGKPVRMIGAVLDVTERRQMEEERRELFAHQVAAQEEERRRLADDIHDDSIQAMTAVGIRLSTLSQQLAGDQRKETIDRLQRSVEAAISRLRHLMFQLRPRALDEEGLGATLRIFLAQLETDEGVTSRLEDRLVTEPPYEVRANLYRIVQEALANVRKHARGALVTVTMEERDDGYYVRVRDDGPGFDASVMKGSPSGHIGLSSMRERATMAGGWWRVESKPERGTTVEVWLPANGASPSPVA
jgi:PAS domain S-box-containing protein